MSTTVRSSRLLRWALRANAGFSTLSAVVLIGFSESAAAFLGAAEPEQMITLGIQLAVFAAWLVWLASRAAIPRWQVAVVIVLDAVWVASSAAMLLSPPPPLTVGGKWAIALVAEVVGLFGVLQFVGLRRLRRGGLEA